MYLLLSKIPMDRADSGMCRASHQEKQSYLNVSHYSHNISALTQSTFKKLKKK